MDLLGLFTAAKGQLRCLIIAVDYFTKWIEAKPLTAITSARVQKFLKGMVSQFRIPAEIITDNGTQFVDKKFQELMYEYKNKYPNLYRGNPVQVGHGCEAMIPVDIGEPSWRRMQRLQGSEKENNEALTVELDLFHKNMENARYKDMMEKCLVSARYNKKARPRSF
ncbi:uncharacterized protein LOC133302607 [Gastrolobium bilobum]|uniref:uncharacterized protein LOC133302607 n=1 Tax=Gastrolobium bilobum TaxID=150636 RepID=UPI002AB2AE40|nr:uncharacterized protein LOC133302607 [Gastrolobium bilobum]